MTSPSPALTPRAFLMRGLLAGLLTGLAVFAVAYVVGEPPVEAAIALESAGAESAEGHSHDSHSHADDAHSHDEEAAVVSRDTQRTWGLLTASLAVSIALGGLTALAAAFALGRLGRLTPAQSTAVVALVGFVAVALVPFLLLPPDPPAVGDPATIGTRTAAYFTLLGVSLLGALGAVALAVRLTPRRGAYAAVLAAGGAYLVLVLVTAQLLPTADPIGDFPADTLWDFRRAALLTQLTLWGGLGVALTGLVGRLHRQEQAVRARRELAAAL
jgi:predicted cobalt transporter CbtA